MGSSTHRKTVLQNVSGLKSNRNPQHQRRTGPHTRLTQVWSVLFLSLPLDAVWAFIPHSPLSEETAQILAITCAVITLPFFNQNRVTAVVSHLRALGKNPEQKNARAMQLILLVAATLAVTAKLLVLPSLSSLLGALCAAIVLFGVFRGAQSIKQQRREQAKVLNESPWLQVTLWERQLVFIWGIALLAARFVSLFGSLSLQGTGITLVSTTCFTASLLLLLCLKPNRTAFVGVCKKCRTPIPIAFVDYGSCPSCDQDLQQLL